MLGHIFGSGDYSWYYELEYWNSTWNLGVIKRNVGSFNELNDNSLVLLKLLIPGKRTDWSIRI